MNICSHLHSLFFIELVLLFLALGAGHLQRHTAGTNLEINRCSTNANEGGAGRATGSSNAMTGRTIRVKERLTVGDVVGAGVISLGICRCGVDVGGKRVETSG